MSEFDPLEKNAELEALLAELAPGEDERARLLEEHRQLEKDLLRLADPLPPPDFVSQVMKRVEAAPARAVSRGDVLTAAGIVFGTVAAAVIAFVSSGSGLGGFGLALAELVVKLREVLVAMGSGLLALWTTAALPMVVALSLMLVMALAALKRAVQPAPAKVNPS